MIQGVWAVLGLQWKNETIRSIEEPGGRVVLWVVA